MASSSAPVAGSSRSADLVGPVIIDVPVQLLYPSGKVVWYLDYFSLPEEAAALEEAQSGEDRAFPSEEIGCIIQSTLPKETDGWWQLSPVDDPDIDLHHPSARGPFRSRVPEEYYGRPLAWLVMQPTPPRPGFFMGGRKFSGRRSRAFQISADGTRLELL